MSVNFYPDSQKRAPKMSRSTGHSQKKITIQNFNIRGKMMKRIYTGIVLNVKISKRKDCSFSHCQAKSGAIAPQVFSMTTSQLILCGGKTVHFNPVLWIQIRIEPMRIRILHENKNHECFIQNTGSKFLFACFSPASVDNFTLTRIQSEPNPDPYLSQKPSPNPWNQKKPFGSAALMNSVVIKGY